MTDSILRSYYNVSSSTFVPFAFEHVNVASDLLSGEAQGFAIDAATTYGGTVAVIDTGTPANNLSDVILDASNLVQSGTSPKMVHHLSSPYVRWSAHNLFLNSGSPATQNVTLVTGCVYTYGITGTGSLAGTSGASGTATAGSPVTFTASGTTGTFTVTGSPTTMWINRGEIQVPYLVTTGATRIGIPQSYDAAAAQYGIWIEPAATNLVIQSQFASGWSVEQLTLTPNATIAPDGSTTAASVIENGATNFRSFYPTANITITGGATYTASVYVKAAPSPQTLDFGVTNNSFNSGFFMIVNTSTGVITSPTAFGTGSYISSSSTSIGNGWYRITITGTVSAAGTLALVWLQMKDGSSYTGDGVSGFYVWGAQLELDTVASSYVPTLGATSTRAADDIRVTLTTIPTFSAISAHYQAKVLKFGTSGTVFTSITDAANNNEITQFDTGTQFLLAVTSGAATQAGVTLTRPTINTAFMAAWSAATNSFNEAKDGTFGTRDTTGSMPSSPDRLLLGFTSISAAHQGGTMLYYLAVLPRAMDDTELDAKTT